jgi:cyclophilin family peptidyl-prolyl cis-trans isomerase
MFKSAFLSPALLCAAMLLAAPLALAQAPAKPAAKPGEPAKTAAPSPHVLMHTSLGDITIELNADKAPKSVDNFLQYVKDDFYSGTVFERVIPGFLAQGGRFNKELQLKRARAPIRNEANNGLSNLKYTIGVARNREDPHSGSAEFFFNLVDNKRLDYSGDANTLTWGYCVFGKVIKGQDVVDKIGATPTGPSGPLQSDVPTTMITIDKVEIID